MKPRVLPFLVSLIAFVLLFAAPSKAAEQMAVFTIGSNVYIVNGQQCQMDVAPYTKDGRTFLPVRFVADALGVASDNILWDGSKVTIIKGDRVAQLTIGDKVMLINGACITMDVAPEVVAPGRAMLPLRWVARALGAEVGWNPERQQVVISLAGGQLNNHSTGYSSGKGQAGNLAAAPQKTGIDESDIEDITTPSVISAIREGKIPPLSVRPEAGPSVRPEQRPEVVGSSRFKEIVNEALDLLYERDREDYRLVCYYLPKVEEAPGSFVVIVNGKAQTFFLNLPQNYPEEDAVYYTAGGLVHEATHTWLAEKGYEAAGEVGEYFATAVHMRSLLKVGAPGWMLQDPDEAIKSRWWERPEQSRPVVPGLGPPAGLHVTSIVPDNEVPNSYRVTLSWDPVSGASGYKVYTKALWLPNAGCIAHETQTNSYTTSFYVGYPGAEAMGHPGGRASWEIYVTAVNPSGEGPPSNAVTVDLPPVSLGVGTPGMQPGVVVLPPLQYSGGLETIRNTYTWNYEGKEFSWTIEVPQVLVNYEQNQKMLKWPLWYLFAASNPSMWFASLFATGSPITMAQEILSSMLVNDKTSSEYIGCVADHLDQAAQAQGYDYFHKAEFIAAFVQSIPYRIVLPTNTQYPPQVIAHGGDCINKSVLLAAILEKLGYRVAILVYPLPIAHAAVGVSFSLDQVPPDRTPLYGYTRGSTTYYFIDATDPGYKIGELTVPESAKPVICEV